MKSTTPPNLMDKAMCLSMTMSRMWTRRELQPGAVDAKAVVDGSELDKTAFHHGKDILDPKALKGVIMAQDKVRRFLWEEELPSKLFKAGVHLVAMDRVVTVEKTLKELQVGVEAAVEQFIEALPGLKVAQAVRLGPLYDPDDYPVNDNAARALFKMSWQWITFGVPGQLQKLDAALFTAQAKAFNTKLAEAEAEIQNALRVALADWVDYLVDRLADADGGKPKRFRASAIEKVQSFLDALKARNITNDAALNELADQARSLLEGVDADVLRKRADTRKEIQEGFAKLKVAVDELPMERPNRRAITFEEEGAAPAAP